MSPTSTLLRLNIAISLIKGDVQEGEGSGYPCRLWFTFALKPAVEVKGKGLGIVQSTNFKGILLTGGNEVG